MDRRTFLKITGLGSVAFATGCTGESENNLYSLVKAPDDMVTGKAAWYATTCRECPAGCGVLAKNRDGRVIKLEGNPLHPVNHGKLCARGQASLQALYNPDRISQPLLKVKGRFERITFDQAVSLVRQRIFAAAAAGPNRVGMLTEIVGRSLMTLFSAVLSSNRSKGPLVFEPFAFESLKYAHRQMFSTPILPGYHMDRADLLISFGADFLETWLSPVEYAAKFKHMHALNNGGKGAFVFVGPNQTLTAANADVWLKCPPGREIAVLMGLIHEMLRYGRGNDLPAQFRAALKRLANDYPPARVSRLSGISEDRLQRLVQRLLSAQHPLVLGSATAASGPHAAAVDLASVMLNALLDPTFALYDFAQRHRVEIAQPRRAIYDFIQRLVQHPLDLLILHNVNPLFNLPPASEVAKALSRDGRFVVAMTNFMDETAAASDLILPVQLPLETWDVYESRRGLASTLQPTVGKLGTAPNIGDLFLQLLPPRHRPARDYRGYLISQAGGGQPPLAEKEWLGMVQRGGNFESRTESGRPDIRFDQRPALALSALVAKIAKQTSSETMLCLTPSLRHFDGRGANRPWLSEIPDPISQVAWQSLAWMHPATLKDKGWTDGQLVRLTTANGSLDVPVYGHPGMAGGTVLIPMGQGHSQYGRYAKDRGINPIKLLDAGVDAETGAPVFSAAVKTMAAAGSVATLAMTSGSRTQYDRKIALSVALKDAMRPAKGKPGLAMNDFPLTLPLPEGYDPHRDIYPAHDHVTYRWGMIVDLDRCIGCSACVAACYAENNIGIVGQRQIAKGREMAWLRIERYYDEDNPERLMFLPMMCQHCDAAPCESVCPVYAPHHSKEGLNNQIYNRCIGTRFCAQNCPYKVRRFNWFDWQWPDPLPMQLNPLVTVRSKGVMEKCSFCIQRIKVAHGVAKDQNRAVRDGEVVPACVQTCPTDALIFGNLMDPKSRARMLADDTRAYQVLGYLNTKPAVIYLKKVIQEL
jgi:molybdopterin-containing oxidoreductase family iron-sulfur binding subunit